MQPIQITIRDISASKALEQHIRDEAEKLEHYYQRIQSCRVVVCLAQKNKHQGKLFKVTVDVTVPGKDLVVNHKLNEDPHIAVRDAFSAVLRQIEKYADKRRGEIKTHEGINRGLVKRIIPNEGYGFIQDAQGTEHYFSLTNVSYPSFVDLNIGDEVKFLSEPANDGWQAHRVTRYNHMINNK
jgi:ribosomal subunit interface protein